MASYGLGFSHTEVSQKCSELTTSKKRSRKDLRSLWRRVVKPDTAVDTFLTIRSEQATSTKPQIKILGGRYTGRVQGFLPLFSGVM